MAEQPDEDDALKAASSKGETAIHSTAISQFDQITSFEQEERALSLQDRRFVSIAGAQWEGPGWDEQFANSIKVEVNKTAQGVEKIIADYRANRMTVNFRAVGGGASEDTAEALNGMFRADLYASKGQQATDNAFEEAVQGGRGAWRLTNKYVDEYDAESDEQRICFEMIPDADQSVFWDPNARLYDKSDANYCFVVTAMAKEAFLAEYGDDRLSDWPDPILKPYYDWYTPDVVRVADYYAVEERREKLLIFEHRASGQEQRRFASDMDEGEAETMEIEGWRLMRERMVKRRRIRKWVMSGAEILRGGDKGILIAGQCIPVIPVYGKRWFIDNMERCRGHVRLAKDPQRIYNAQISKLTETAALAPIERPIFFPEQVAGHAESWANANIDRAPYSLINPIIGVDGNPIPAGPISSITPPQLSPVLGTLIQITASDIGELTSADDGAQEVKANVSAEAMDIAATRTDARSFTYMDNMRQSMQRCGEVYLSMAADVYVEEGRLVQTMDEDGGQGTATIQEPYTDDSGKYRIRNDLSRGKYYVISDVTEATTTRRDKTVKTLVQASQAVAPYDPELASAMMGVAMINMDGEGMTDLQDWMRTRLVQQGIVKPNEQEQAAMEAAAQEEQPPDPQSQALIAVAEKETALAGKAEADTILSRAKVEQTLADAELKRSQAQRDNREDRPGFLRKVVSSLTGRGAPPPSEPPPPAP